MLLELLRYYSFFCSFLWIVEDMSELVASKNVTSEIGNLVIEKETN
ncbi:hypothetical protein [Lysinibacillus sp. NPDC093692]